MAEKLPKFVILQSKYNDKYLRLNDANADQEDALDFGGDYSFSLETRFELEPATSGDGLYHIRSLYNNKYWLRRSTSDHWVTASATDPEEDSSKSYCTLFKPVFVNDGDNRTVRFREVYTDKYVCLWRDGTDRIAAIYSTTDEDQCDVYTIIDWESVVLLPNRIVIKGDNDLYLRTWKDGFMDFSRDSLGNEDLEYEVTPSRNGGIRLKSIPFGYYWRDDSDSSWVFADGNDPTIHSTDTVFIPVKLGDTNKFALRCLRNSSYCNRFSNSEKTNCLATVTSHIENEGLVAIEEPVLSRKIDSFNYNTSDARISKEKTILVMNQDITNKTQETDTVKLDIKYTDTMTSRWSSSVLIKVGVKTKISTDVPCLADGSIEISGEFSNDYNWGDIVETKTEVESTYTASVPAMSRVKVSLMVTQGSCSIPYSYSQHDVLIDGTPKVFENDDGWYSCQNSYNYRYQTEQFPLDDPAS